MPKIEVLSTSVANKIAAGEVAERPSAVVKELVENSLDAGATEITVEIKGGGIRYIRVSDNGSGIAAGDVKTAFLRHATSKLRNIDDLYSLETMGFRGEALASICAVAEVEVITRTPEQTEGVFLKISGGKAVSEESVACQVGTVMVVRELFANVPARMKFLKRDKSESGYVADLLGRLAMANTGVAFDYICDEKQVFSTPGDGSLQNAILKIYGLDVARALIDVDYEEDGVKIRGVVGDKSIARGNRTRQTLYVNGRYIKSAAVSKVVEEAYKNRLMVGRFPFFVLNIEILPEYVDVNVHPAKTEVKFANERRLMGIINHAVRSVLSEDSITTSEEKPKGAKELFFSSGAGDGGGQSVPAPVQFKVKTDLKKKNFKEAPPREIINEFIKSTVPEQKENVMRQETFEVRDIFGESILFEEEEKPKENIRVVGQVFDTYVILRSDENMYVIDQHAAHERFNFEKIKRAYKNKERLTQSLIVPITINLGYDEMQAVCDGMEMLRAFGFDIEEFGTNSVIVSGTPVMGSEGEIRDLVLELSQAMAENIKKPLADFEERTLDMISCKSAIKANKKLSHIEMEDLTQKVLELEEQGITTCPHGRPIKIAFSKDDIEKMFGRKL